MRVGESIQGPQNMALSRVTNNNHYSTSLLLFCQFCNQQVGYVAVGHNERAHSCTLEHQNSVTNLPMYHLMGFVLTFSRINALNDIPLHNEVINVTMLLAPMAHTYIFLSVIKPNCSEKTGQIMGKGNVTIFFDLKKNEKPAVF